MNSDYKRSLWDCMNARVKGKKVYCIKEHQFSAVGVGITQVARGAPLRFTVCQKCPDFVGFDAPPPLERSDMGWEPKGVTDDRDQSKTAFLLPGLWRKGV